MRKMILAILRAVLLLPFTAGARGDRSGPFRLYDCSTSSVVLLSGLLAMVVVFTGSLAIAKDLVPRLMAIIVILIIITIAGIFACFLISFTIFRHGWLSNSTALHQGIRSKNLQLLFLWLFAISASVYFCFNVITQIECEDTVSVIKITQSVLIVFFMIWETVLISVLASYKIQALPVLQYSMRFLIAVNMSVWFNAVIRENTPVLMASEQNSSRLVIDYINCVQNSTSGKMYTKSWRFLSPAFVEFSLLSVTLLAEIIAVNFPNHTNKAGTLVNTLEYDKGNYEDIVEVEDEEIKDTKESTEKQKDEINKENENENDMDENTHLLSITRRDNFPRSSQNTNHGNSSVIEIGSNSGSRISTRSSVVTYYRMTVGTPISLYVTIGLSVVVSLPTFVGYAIQATMLPNNEILTSWLSWYEVVIKSLMLLAAALGFYFLENITAPPVSNSEPLKTKDWIFLLSVLSMFISHCFEMLGGYLSESNPANAIFVANCVSVTQDYFQTVLLLQAARCQQNVPFGKCTGFVSLCLFMTITNFGCWVVDGFIIAHSLKQTRKETMSVLAPTIWESLSSIFLPLTLYFRFASAFAFHDLYKTYNPKSKMHRLK